MTDDQPDWCGERRRYHDLLSRREAVQRGIDAYEREHPDWKEPEPKDETP